MKGFNVNIKSILQAGAVLLFVWVLYYLIFSPSKYEKNINEYLLSNVSTVDGLRKTFEICDCAAQNRIATDNISIIFGNGGNVNNLEDLKKIQRSVKKWEEERLNNFTDKEFRPEYTGRLPISRFQLAKNYTKAVHLYNIEYTEKITCSSMEPVYKFIKDPSNNEPDCLTALYKKNETNLAYGWIFLLLFLIVLLALTVYFLRNNIVRLFSNSISTMSGNNINELDNNESNISNQKSQSETFQEDNKLTTSESTLTPTHSHDSYTDKDFVKLGTYETLRKKYSDLETRTKEIEAEYKKKIDQYENLSEQYRGLELYYRDLHEQYISLKISFDELRTKNNSDKKGNTKLSSLQSEASSKTLYDNREKGRSFFASDPQNSIFYRVSLEFIPTESKYLITLISPSEGVFELVPDKNTLEQTFSFVDGLKDACELFGINRPVPEDNFRYRNNERGRVRKEGDYWVITKKLPLEWD